MTSITDRTVLVTGASRGLGREFVRQLLARGAGTVYAAARDPHTVEVTAPRVVPVALDVTDPSSVAAAAERVGELDVLVNNAGVSTPTSVISADTSVMRRELEVNLWGPLQVTSAFRDTLVRHEGAVVNVASALAWVALGASYSVSKAALWSATDSMRLELGPQGVQVLGVFMGYVDTDMTRGVTAPKVAPADVVAQVLDGLEAGADEVLADDTARHFRGSLTLPVADRYAAFAG